MLTLYGHPMSRAHRVMWLLREIGIPFEHVPTDFLRGGNKTPDFLRLNPNGKVPVLTDGEMSAVAPRHFDRRWRTDRYWNRWSIRGCRRQGRDLRDLGRP
jgi:hypothetical protein